MKELKAIVQDLKLILESKKTELSLKGETLNVHTSSLLLNREKDIRSLEDHIALVTLDPFQKNNIITEFQAEADLVKKRIGEISNG